MEAMRRMKIDDKLEPNLVVAENVAQAAQFVATGNTSWDDLDDAGELGALDPVRD